MKIIRPVHRKKSCRKCGQSGHHIITCCRPPKKAVRPQNLKPLPEATSPTPGSSNLHLIEEDKGGNFCCAPTPDNLQRLTHDQTCELCKCYGHHTKNCDIIHRNSRSTFKSTCENNTLRANQALQLELHTDIEPDLSIAQWIMDDQGCQEYKELIGRNVK